MGRELFVLIRRIGIFIVCAQTISHFRPKASYDKYFKFLISIMVLVQLLTPFLQLLGGEETWPVETVLENYRSVWEGNLEQISEPADRAREVQESYAIREARDRATQEETNVESMSMEENISEGVGQAPVSRESGGRIVIEEVEGAR